MSLSSYMQHFPTQTLYLCNMYQKLTCQAHSILELRMLEHLFISLSWKAGWAHPFSHATHNWKMNV